MRRVAIAWLSPTLASLGCGQVLGEVDIRGKQAEASSQQTAAGSIAPEPAVQRLQPAGAAGGGNQAIGGLALCDPGQTRCRGADLEACSSDTSNWQLVESCATTDLCELGRTSGGSHCEPPACAAQDRVCEGNRLRLCNPGQTGFVDEQICAASQRCDPRQGCSAPPCNSGERRCNGAQIEICDAQQGDFIAAPDGLCVSAQLCTQGQGGTVVCSEPVCAAEQFRCEGSLLQRCADGRNAWLDFQRCASAELCDETLGPQGCLAPSCEAGALRCVGENLELCRDARDGSDPVAACATAGGCDPTALACRDPCVVGGARCVGATLETCDSLLAGWQRRECASPELCNAAARDCDTPLCQAAEQACNGAQPQRCAPGLNGFVDVGAPCETPELCDPISASCIPAACSAGETRCDGVTTLLTCNSGQTGFAGSSCNGLLAICDPSPPAACRSLL